MTGPDEAVALLRRLEAEGERIEIGTPGQRTVWRRWGQGEPLVLLHGGYGTWRHWVRNIPFFAPHRTLLVPDIPGLGESDEVPDPFSPEAVAMRLLEGIEQLVPHGAPIDIVGFSFGGVMSGHVAALLGERLRTLVMVGPGALGVSRTNIMLLKWAEEPDPERIRQMHRTNLALLMIADESRIDDLAVAIQQEGTRHARVKSRRLANTDALAQALRRSVPRHLAAIWGDRDAVAIGQFAEREALLRSIRADLEFHLIPDAGHWVQYEMPEAFNVLLQDILERGRRGAAPGSAPGRACA
jgi:2-hydroxy-6-oxonona-2,4-dienedioate hydrolase